MVCSGLPDSLIAVKHVYFHRHYLSRENEKTFLLMYGAHLTSHGGLADSLNGVMTYEHPTDVFPLVQIINIILENPVDS